MIKLKVLRIIDFFDYPQLFLARDMVLTNFLCMLVESNDRELKYVAIKISPRKVYELEANKCDLRSAFENPEIDEYYYFNLTEQTDEYFEIVKYTDSIESYLPDAGLYVGSIVDNDDLKKLALENNKNIYKLHITEEGRSGSVSATLVSSFLLLTQKIIKNSFIQGVKNASKEIKKRITELSSAEMGVFAFSNGSLNVLFSTNSFVDMFGISDDQIFLKKLKEIVDLDISDLEMLKMILRRNKGHLITSLEQLCKKIIDTGSRFELFYSTPNKNDNGQIIIDKGKATIFYDFINTEIELKDEIVEFQAIFVQADVEKGNWRIRVSEDDTEISGKSTAGQLSGVTLEEKEYKIYCHEVLVEDQISGQEKKQYDLVSYELISL